MVIYVYLPGNKIWTNLNDIIGGVMDAGPGLVEGKSFVRLFSMSKGVVGWFVVAKDLWAHLERQIHWCNIIKI